MAPYFKIEVIRLKYNEFTNQFEIEVSDVTQHTDYTSEDLKQHGIDLRKISRDTYRILNNFYKGPNPQQHAENLQEYIIQKEKANGLMFVMIEFLHGAMISGMDLNTYTNEFFHHVRSSRVTSKPHFSSTLREEARVQGLYFVGKIRW